MLIVDWLPTFMGLATNNTWSGSYSDADIDGFDIWSSITSNVTPDESRDEIVFISYPEGSYAMQYQNMKYIYDLPISDRDEPLLVFPEDLAPETSRMVCDDPIFSE